MPSQRFLHLISILGCPESQLQPPSLGQLHTSELSLQQERLQHRLLLQRWALSPLCPSLSYSMTGSYIVAVPPFVRTSPSNSKFFIWPMMLESVVDNTLESAHSALLLLSTS